MKGSSRTKFVSPTEVKPLVRGYLQKSRPFHFNKRSKETLGQLFEREMRLKDMVNSQPISITYEFSGTTELMRTTVQLT